MMALLRFFGALSLFGAAPAVAFVHPIGLISRQCQSGSRRASALSCAEQPPRDLDTVCADARRGLREALLCGKRCLSVDANMPMLDVSSRGYAPEVLSRFALEVSQALNVLEGTILFLLPGVAAVREARMLLEKEGFWPDAEDRVRISSLSMEGLPPVDSELPGAVVIVGLARSASADDMAVVNARAWIRSCVVSLCINWQLETVPAELTDCESAYCLLAYTIARSDLSLEEPDLHQTDAGSAMLMRTFPHDWRVMIDLSNTKTYTEVAQMIERPSREQLNDLLIPRAQEHQAALDSAQASLEQDAVVKRRASQISSEDEGRSMDEPKTVDANGVVSLTWKDIQAPGWFGPMAIYTAVTLLRMRSLGGAGKYGSEQDARGVHLVLPELRRDCEAAWTQSFGRLSGEILGSCQMIPDALGAQLAAIDQVAVTDEISGENVCHLLSRAVADARQAQQTSIIALAPSGRSGQLISTCLEQLGFGSTSKLPAASAALGSVPGAVCLDLNESLEVSSNNDDVDYDGVAVRNSTEGARQAPPADAASSGTQLDDGQRIREDADPDRAMESAADDSVPGASAQDIEMLKRMFGSSGVDD